MTDSENRTVVRRLKRLSQIEPSRESTELALGHARAALTNAPAATAGRLPEPARPWNRLAHWMGGLTMRQRIAALGSIGVAAILGFLLFWGGIVAKPVSAMEKMAESICNAKSYKATISHQTPVKENSNTPPTVDQSRFSSVMYWLAPSSYRQDSTYPNKIPWKGPGPERTSIFFEDKPGIFVNNRAKTFHRTPARRNPRKGSLSPEEWGHLSGKADRDLGTKEFNGRKAIGFEIDVKELSPEYPERGIMEIWIDAESSLPVHTCLTIGAEAVGPKLQLIEDYEWNIDLDPKLFDTTPPDGYTDATRKPPALEEQILDITGAFKIYSDASGGHYSQVKTFFYQTPLDLRRMLIAKSSNPHPGTAKELSAVLKETRVLYATADKGFGVCHDLQTYNSDFAYNGQTVGPMDKGKVLLRWKLDDGRYEVIFGDLRTETVTAERLRALEGK
jgi:outer membrane lipoprotein-sorting protein